MVGVRAVVRVRPLLSHESHHEAVVFSSGQTVEVNQRTFGSFFAALDGNTSQAETYDKSGVSEYIDAALQGFSATVLAYGQTGSGKTHSLMGDDDGLVPRAVHTLFQKTEDGSWRIRASFCEIGNAPGAVNECITDLLAPGENLQLRYGDRGPFVADLTAIQLDCFDDAVEVLREGQKNRRTSQHALNSDSSRTHSLFTLFVEHNDTKRTGKLTFVDLAGSERLKATRAEGLVRKETQAINKSLFTLGQVILALAEGKFVPYRNSKLTELLRESLGGNSLCLMLTCLAPNSEEESKNSLLYAARAMKIENHPTICMEAEAEINILRKENQVYRDTYGPLPADISGLQSMAHTVTTSLRTSTVSDHDACLASPAACTPRASYHDSGTVSSRTSHSQVHDIAGGEVMRALQHTQSGSPACESEDSKPIRQVVCQNSERPPLPPRIGLPALSAAASTNGNSSCRSSIRGRSYEVDQPGSAREASVLKSESNAPATASTDQAAARPRGSTGGYAAIARKRASVSKKRGKQSRASVPENRPSLRGGDAAKSSKYSAIATKIPPYEPVSCDASSRDQSAREPRLPLIVPRNALDGSHLVGAHKGTCDSEPGTVRDAGIAPMADPAMVSVRTSLGTMADPAMVSVRTSEQTRWGLCGPIVGSTDRSSRSDAYCKPTTSLIRAAPLTSSYVRPCSVSQVDQLRTGQLGTQVPSAQLGTVSSASSWKDLVLPAIDDKCQWDKWQFRWCESDIDRTDDLRYATRPASRASSVNGNKCSTCGESVGDSTTSRSSSPRQRFSSRTVDDARTDCTSNTDLASRF